jgi:YHS domain-containing protein
MKNLTETIRQEIIENDLVENFEIINECSVMVNGKEKFQVQPENVAQEVLEDFKNYDGFEAHSFNCKGETYYFVKQ